MLRFLKPLIAACALAGDPLTMAQAEDALADTLVRARAAGVSGFIAVGTDLEDSRKTLELARTTPGIQASLGLDRGVRVREILRVMRGCEEADFHARQCTQKKNGDLV